MKGLKNKSLLLIGLIITMSLVINGCVRKAPQGVIATVNKEYITIEEFDKEYEIQAKTMENRLGQGVLDQTGTDGRLISEELEDEILNIFIIEKLILQDAERNKLTVSDDKIEQRIEDIKANMGGEEELKDYQETVGMDDDYLKMFTRKNIILEKHKSNYMDNLQLEDKEMQEFFDQNKDKLKLVKARQIIVETEEEGQEILKELEAGGDFNRLAIERSIDQDTALKGGELGYFSKGSNPKDFDELVFEMESGDLSPLIQTEIGYHIVEIQDLKDTFESLKEEVVYFANENKYIEYLEKLQDDAKIETYLEERDKE